MKQFTSPLRPFPSLTDGAARIAVERAIAEMRAGRPVLVADGERRLVVLAAELVSDEVMDDLARLAPEGAGIVLTGQRLRHLGLAAGGARRLPVEADAALARGLSENAEIALPAHPGRAACDAEIAALDLARFAQLLPAVVVAGPIEAGRPWMGALLTVEATAIGEHREAAAAALEIVSRATIPLAGGGPEAEFVVFRGGEGLRDQVAVIVGRPDPAEPVPVRLHSACLTGDLFGSLRCDCGDQLRRAVASMAETGGVLLYLDQEGRGTGIGAKMRAYALQDTGLDTVQADAVLGYGIDEREYGTAARMLVLLGFRRLALMTNNPDKIAAMEAAGLEIAGRTPLLGTVTDQNRRYLDAKARKAGHFLTMEQARATG